MIDPKENDWKDLHALMEQELLLRREMLDQVHREEYALLTGDKPLEVQLKDHLTSIHERIEVLDREKSAMSYVCFKDQELNDQIDHAYLEDQLEHIVKKTDSQRVRNEHLRHMIHVDKLPKNAVLQEEQKKHRLIILDWEEENS